MAEPPCPVYPPKPNPRFDFRGVRRDFDYPLQMRFLHELRKSGLKHHAAESLGIPVRCVNQLAATDKDFAEAMDEAIQCWVDCTLVVEAVRRSVDGVQEPVIGGKDRDQIITYKQVYSDSMLMFLMRARREEFRAANVQVGTGNGKYATGQGGVMALPASPQTPTEWEESLGALCRAPADASNGASGASSDDPGTEGPRQIESVRE